MAVYTSWPTAPILASALGKVGTVPDTPASSVISDEELTALALAADPDQPLDPDAVPFVAGDAALAGLLPAWYMPATAGARRWILGAMAIGFVAISACGMCVTNGFPELPL